MYSEAGTPVLGGPVTTRDDVIDAINRIERAGHAGEATKTAQIEVLTLPPQYYDGILDRLRATFPELFPPADRGARTPATPPIPAAPHGNAGQQGVAARAMKNAETALSQQQSAVAEFDRQVIEALLHAHKTTQDGRRLLDELQTQIESAARGWELSTPAGARAFQRFLIAKLGQIIQVVEEANDDDTSKRALAAAWSALYAAQADGDGPASAGPDDSPSGGAGPQPAADPELGSAPALDYLDSLPDDPPPGDAGIPQHSASVAPAAPAVPSLGGQPPGLGALPGGGASGGFPLGGWPAGLQSAQPAQFADEPPQPDGALRADDASFDEPNEPDRPNDPAAEPPENQPDTVILPDGETITVATPQLASVIQAAADGTPVADAFRQQGVTIPPPGTPVIAPIDQSRVGPGDIGMFTDRHALALGNSKALLDGQIQHIGNVRGPSFLGWQHPPMLTGSTAPTPVPSPTRPSATLRV